MKETGLLMRPELALATRERRKTMTRRPLKVQPPAWAKFYQPVDEGHEWIEHNRDDDSMRHWPDYYKPIQCPYGKPGDRLYVKESFKLLRHDSSYRGAHRDMVLVQYKDWQEREVLLTEKETNKLYEWKKPRSGKDASFRSSLFMFKSLARTWMEITAVRAERIQDITNDDAMREGVPAMMKTDPITMDYSADHLGPFKYLWDSINKARGNGWDENKWQWVITYKLIEP